MTFGCLNLRIIRASFMNSFIFSFVHLVNVASLMATLTGSLPFCFSSPRLTMPNAPAPSFAPFTMSACASSQSFLPMGLVMMTWLA
uniref:Candidate secreted effector n=1 Tax=Meloidogyne incognita TaxID=6306 RepID=A0A914NJJ4_MELIC